MITRSLGIISVLSCLLGPSCSSVTPEEPPEEILQPAYEIAFAGFDTKNPSQIRPKLVISYTCEPDQALFIRAHLPLPNGANSLPAIKMLQGGPNKQAYFLGPDYSFWQHGQPYRFRADIYTDANFATKIQSLAQTVVYVDPSLGSAPENSAPSLFDEDFGDLPSGL